MLISQLLRRKFKFILAGAGLLALLAILFLTPQVKDYSEFKASYPLSERYLLSQDGRIISSLRNDFSKKNLAWFDLNQISSDFIAKLLQQEDHRFYSHYGIDFLALTHATYEYATGSSKRGASTISMQLAKNLYSLKTKSFLGKLQQMILAAKIEIFWSKPQILEAYLNLIYLHGQIQGIGSASLALFDKTPLYINSEEQNTLLKLIKSPNLLLKSVQASHEKPVELASHYHRFLLRSKNFSTQSSLDYDLQSFAVQSVKTHLDRIQQRNVHDAAVIVIDNRNNKVLAYVGGNPETTQTPYVDMAQAPRQIGSTIKPFLYATALDQNVLKISSWIEDSPVDIVYQNGTYSPKNHDQQFHGWVHTGTALASSLNVPAVKTIQLVGVENVWTNLKKLNFNLEHDPDYYGPSLALGVLDASLWQLVHAYQNFVQDENKTFSSETKQRIIWMISRAQNRALTFGQDSLLTVPQGFAVKTGTSKDMKDNWTVGFNRDFTVGVWVGNSDSSSMQNVLGVTGAAPIWRDVVNYLLNSKLSTSSILLTSEQDQKFLAEEQSAEAHFDFKQNSIVSPAPHSIYAIDPAIPNKFQKIILEASGPQENLIWKYKGQILKSNKLALEKGWQKIELYQKNKKIDESLFLVK